MSTNIGIIFRILLIQFPIETTIDYLLIIGENIHDKNDFEVSELLLLGVTSNNHASSTSTLNATIQYLLATKRFVIVVVALV